MRAGAYPESPVTTLIFIGAQLGAALFGAPAFFHKSLRGFPGLARFSAAFLLGHVILTTYATLLSLVGIRWNILTMALPLLVAAIVFLAWRHREGVSSRAQRGIWVGARKSRHPDPSLTLGMTRPRDDTRINTIATVVAAIAVIHLALRLISGRASSVDYLYFWSAKAVRFLNLGGIEDELLRWIWATHTHPNYPQLFPISLAWGGLISGEIPWLGALLTCLVWLLIGVPLLFSILGMRLSSGSAAVVTSFWTTAMAIALAHSYSGANAEPMLLVFETIALATVLIETPGTSPTLRWLAGIALAGTVLTKVEGMLAWFLILAGVIIRDLWWKRPQWIRSALPLLLWPGLTLGCWVLFELVYRIPLRDTSRESGLALHFDQIGTVFSSMIRHSSAGSLAIPWLIAFAGIVLPSRNAKSVLPGFALGIGLLVILMVHYLHVSYEPAILIQWTFPRISLPALSALILTSGVLSFGETAQPS